jgi:hypothetical protein
MRLKITSWGEVLLDKREVNALMRSAGNDVKTKTARLIAQSSGGGRLYRIPGGKRYRASAAGEAPARRTGALYASLKNYVLKRTVGFAVRARAFYALMLESGARGGGNPGTRGVRRTGQRRRARGIYTQRVMEARPFLDRVMAREAPDIDRRVRLALSQALKWKETN